MESQSRNGTTLKILLGIIGGGLLTLLFSTINTVHLDSQRIAKLEAIAEIQINMVTDVAALKVMSETNTLGISRIETAISEHMRTK